MKFSNSLAPLNLLLPHILLISCVSNLFMGFPSAFAQSGNETDRLALLDIKAKITHDPLGILNSWNDSTHFCLWHGVTCGARHRRVTALDLRSQKLAGPISPHVGNLSFLRALNLQNNTLGPEIPMELGNLRRLQILRLHNNSITGEIPVNISACSNLVRISLANNKLVGNIPAQLGFLSRLEMPRLHRIVVSLNHLGNGKNDDSSFFSSLINVTSLEELAVDGNNLEGVLPESISNFSTILSKMNLAENFMFGSIPVGLGNLIQLETINMGGNQFSGNIPNGIGNLHKLKVLNISDNKLLGNIPSSLGNLSMLINFNLGGNNLQGTIPSSLGNCRNLARLELAKNKLSGTLPAEALGIVTLVVFDVSQNNLTGSLPVEVGNLINLEKLDVSENMFSGEIPSSLSRCVRVERLYMQGNLFSGAIPSLLSSLRGIQFLDLSHNNLSGEIPDYLEEFKFLQSLNLSFNDFEGSVPTEGVFENTSAISVLGNENLCGGVEELDLPTCIIEGSTKKTLSLTVIISLYSPRNYSTLSMFGIICLVSKKRNKAFANSTRKFTFEGVLPKSP
ncbi:putative receptor-like protein kinase At3g47110 [Rhododendron vialii]|uniref:putative receptor-like protein kinase At3g47110 n=1 Tax=Rhododendron vialii TaxID=182163 RepID=UPI0026600FD6|nr:putative receptor-like protein kinase At3g47110 [Rhododendron vialii]